LSVCAIDAQCSVADALQLLASSSRLSSRRWVLSDISPFFPLKAAAEWTALMLGPELFQPYNLLQRVDAPSHQLSLCSITIATIDSHSSTRCSPYAADLACSIVEGSQLWLMAPPERAFDFRRLFPAESSELNVSGNVVPKFTELMNGLQGYIICAHAGDVVFVPGGWVYAVKFLQDSVSYNHLYLRPWKLSQCLEWARAAGCAEALRRVNLDAVMSEQLLRADVWGVPQSKLDEARSGWRHLRVEFDLQEALTRAQMVAQSLRNEDEAASIQTLALIKSTSTSDGALR
jgi:hypothetical protein